MEYNKVYTLQEAALLLFILFKLLEMTYNLYQRPNKAGTEQTGSCTTLSP